MGPKNVRSDYELLDSGAYEKLERWGDYILIRPEPTALWRRDSRLYQWYQADGHYLRNEKNQGQWQFRTELPNNWIFHYKDLRFKIVPSENKHTGLFPEQAINWQWMEHLIHHAQKPVQVLNLFAYTGAASLVCAQAGAQQVVHVDASRSIVNWAKENRDLSSLEDYSIRFLVDDCVKFVQKEQRRENRYQAIIMDPPSYGRGPNNEIWKIEDQLQPLIEACLEIFDTDNPLFFLINTYTTNLSVQTLKNIMIQNFGHLQGTIEVFENGLPHSNNDLTLPCGVCARWSK